MYETHVLNPEIIMNSSFRSGCFDLPISEVFQINTWGILDNHVQSIENIYYQDGIYPLLQSKYSLENVTELVTENCNLVISMLLHVWCTMRSEWRLKDTNNYALGDSTSKSQ